MKKLFLFSFLAVFLAGLGFGGISMAEGEAYTATFVDSDGNNMTLEEGKSNPVTSSNNGVISKDNIPTCDGTWYEGNTIDPDKKLSSTTLKKDITLTGNITYLCNTKYEALVGEKKYETFSKAVLSSNEGIITLLKKVSTAYSMETNQVIKVKKNGQTFPNPTAPDGLYEVKSSTEDGVTTYTVGEPTLIVINGNETVGYKTISAAITAVKSKENAEIKVNDDLSLAGVLNRFTVDSNYNFTLNLNSHKIIMNGAYFTVNGAKITVKNGTIHFKGNMTQGFIMNSGEIDVEANAKIEGEGKVSPIAIFGNATVNISGTLAADSFALAGNGSNGKGGYTINIDGGTITSTNAPAIYHPNTGNLNINGGTIEGTEALYIKAGTTTITDGILKGKGAKADYIYNGNGTNPTGDGIVIENADYPGGNPTVTINGGTISSTNNKAIGYYKKEDRLIDPNVTSNSNKMTLTDGWLWTQLESDNTYKPTKGVIVTFKDGDEEIEKQTIANGGNVSKPEDPTKEGYVFIGWFNGEEVFDFETPISADTTLTSHWATALTASTSSIKAASVPNDEGREKRNLDKFSVSNSYDATSKTLTVTITDNGMEAYTGGNSENAKKWLGLIADFETIVNGSKVKDPDSIVGYTIGDIDRTDANIYGGDADSSTDFIIWINREDKDGKTIRFVNAAAEDDYVNVKFVFKDKQSSSSSSSSGGGGGGGSSSSSCKSLPSNAVANNNKKPSSSTNYFYDTDTTKICSFVCKKGYEWVEKTSKCEAVTTTTTTGDTADTSKAEENKSDIDNNTNTTEDWYKDSDNDGTLDNGLSKELVDAYIFSHDKGITTMNNPIEADMFGPLNRIAMAKMLSQYAINVLGKTPDTSRVVPAFPDVDEQLNKDYNDGVTLAYQLGIMGINIDSFRPFDLVTRAEFGTALSRMLFGLSDGEEDLWYKPHLDKLMNEKIITIDTPDLQELRGYVMIMLMRSAQ